jgi:hypothetical protein
MSVCSHLRSFAGSVAATHSVWLVGAMARGKAKARAKAPSRTASRSNAAEWATPNSNGTLDELEHQAAARKRRKEVDNHDAKVRKAVKKCIRDNLGGMTDPELHVKCVKGQTCFEKLMHDKSIAVTDPSKAPAFGKLYFEGLRTEYTEHKCIEGLVVQVEEEVDKEMYQAVCQSRDEGKREKLIQWCQSSSHEPHQGEVCVASWHMPWS